MIDLTPLKDTIRAVTAYRLNLIGISNIMREREQKSWRPMQHDEDWIYLTERDVRVCPICKPLESTIFRGDYIAYKFIHYKFIDALHIEPNVHFNCRCVLEWSNSAEAIKDRLMEELFFYDIKVQATTISGFGGYIA